MTIKIRTILVPIDFSDSARAIIEWAAHLAGEQQSKLVLFHAYHLPVEFQQLEGAYLPPDFWANVKAEARESLARYAAELRESGCSVESVVGEGYAATAIVDEAIERGRRPHRDRHPRPVGSQAPVARQCRRTGRPEGALSGPPREGRPPQLRPRRIAVSDVRRSPASRPESSEQSRSSQNHQN